MNSKVERILVPVDFSIQSEFAVRYGVALAHTFGAEVLLLHVLPVEAYAPPPMAAIPTVPERMRKDAERALENLVALHRDPAVTIKSELADGVADMEIVEAVDRCEADLVCIGTHGRTGLPHILLGSVAERVVRTCPVPVLVVHPPKQWKDEQKAG